MLAVLAASCTVEPVAGRGTVIEASVPEEVKTAFGDKTGNVVNLYWQPGDAININGRSSDPLEGGYIPSRSARFIFSDAVLSTPYYAVSPASAVSSYASASAVVSIPAEQEYVEGSYDPAAGLMLAVSGGESMNFSLSFSMMRLTVAEGTHTAHKIRRVRLTARGGEQMAGAFTTNFTTLTDRAGGLSSVVVESEAGIPLGGEVVLVFAPRTYAQGLSIEIVDESGHYMVKNSTASFTAAAGRIYNTSLTFEPTGTYIDGGASGVDNSAAELNTWEEMNAWGHTENSHADAYSRSNLTMIGGTYVQVPEDRLGMISGNIGVVYPRFIQTSRGDWLMFYHYGNSSTWAGNYCSYLRSPDLKNWTFEKKLFAVKNNQMSDYYASETLPQKFSRYYAGADLCTLPDGRILAVAATRPGSNYKLRPFDSGLAIRYSADGGLTWTDDQLVLVGTCWEPFPVVLPSGRIQIYYTDARPHYPSGNTTWKGTEVTGSGVSYIYSDDNGATWVSTDGNGDHLIGYRQLRTVSEVDGTKLYCDQMPSVLVLNAGAGLAGAGESLKKSLSPGFKVCTAYTGPDMEWGTPESDGDFPEDRVNNFVEGAAPYLLQFPSGETVLTFNHDDGSGHLFQYMMGDAQARNFQGVRPVMPSGISGLDEAASAIVSRGFWGSTRLTGSHTLVAGIGGSEMPKTLQVAQFWLNHDIAAPVIAVNMDGKNGEWTTHEALFAGSSTPDQVILRAAHDATKLYLLLESVGDAAAVHADLAAGSTLQRISVNASGLVSSAIGGVSAVSRSARTADGRSGFLCEVSVPLSAFDGQSAVPVCLTLEGAGYLDSFSLASSDISVLPRITLQ